MKEKLLKLLKERKEINLTDLPIIMPEIIGVFSMYIPVKSGYNPNILLLQNVNQDFIIAFNELQSEKIVEFKLVDIMVFIFDNSPIYTIDLCNKKLAKTQKHCWQPTQLILIN